MYEPLIAFPSISTLQFRPGSKARAISRTPANTRATPNIVALGERKIAHVNQALTE